jgi:hypothetical protein
MHDTRTVGSHGGKKVGRLHTVGHIFQPFAVPSEEYGSCSRPVANTDNVALDKWWAVRRWVKGLVMPAMAGRCVCY